MGQKCDGLYGVASVRCDKNNVGALVCFILLPGQVETAGKKLTCQAHGHSMLLEFIYPTGHTFEHDTFDVVDYRRS
jgi:hypothetical protein